MPNRIAQTSAALFIITLVVAATGYLRELLLARAFGAGVAMDAFYYSMVLIQATQDLIFGATLTATIVPLLHRPEHTIPGRATDPARFTVTVALAIVLAASTLAMVLRAALPYLLEGLAPNMSDPVRAQCLSLSTVLVWLLPLNALTNLLVLVLNAHRRFILAGSVYLFINVTFISVLLLVEPIAGTNSIAIAGVAGPLVVLPILGLRLVHLRLLRPVRPDFSRSFFAPLWRQARPIMLTGGIGSSLGLLMIAHLMVRTFAANSGEGSIAALGYAFRLYEVPLSLLANPAAALMLPSIAILYKNGSMGEIGRISREMLLAGLVVLFPAAVITWVGADLFVQLLLERGNFGMHAAQLTASALRGFAPAIVGEGVIVVFYRFFYAIHRPSRAVVASAAALFALAALLFLFGQVDFIAIPLALSGGFLIGAIIVVYFVVRDVGISSVPDLRSICKWSGSALIGVIVWKLADLHSENTVWRELVTIFAFTMSYFIAILVMFADYRRYLRILSGRLVSQMRNLFRPA